MKRDILYPLRRIHGACHTWLVYLKSLIVLMLFKKVYILGTPEHTNLGDAAIVIAQKNFIKSSGIKEKDIVEISLEKYNNFRKLPLKLTNRKSVIALVGGGNMGDVWFYDEDIRRKIICDFPQNRKIVFPQTCYYSDTEKGAEEKKKSFEIYNKAQRLTLFAREKKSFDMMKELYPNADVMLAPDIVLSARASDFGIQAQNRSGALLCMRGDLEKAIDESTLKTVKAIFEKKGITYTETDTHCEGWCFANKRNLLVKDKLEEFAGAEIVITDRLHGMIFSAITGTPCIALSNYNHKISGTFEFIKYLPYIKFVKTEEEIKTAFSELMSMTDCKYDNTPLLPYYEKLAEELKKR
ncbi:MAG: polysaccharide pyruvyl transferase family protein [Clostridia bacterium]|nr:polysaccharide pyruvyl transferase family protein [Clostridia bacterium]